LVHAQNSAQGFSGSNVGGHLVLQNSEWDHNQSGIVPSSLAIFDLPSPQNGACPADSDDSCTLIQYNLIHDNNNPNTPASGIAATSIIGSGIDLSGGRNNTVQYNVVTNNGSWAIVLNDFADYAHPLLFQVVRQSRREQRDVGQWLFRQPDQRRLRQRGAAVFCRQLLQRQRQLADGHTEHLTEQPAGSGGCGRLPTAGASEKRVMFSEGSGTSPAIRDRCST
jgi:hypothetical protein